MMHNLVLVESEHQLHSFLKCEQKMGVNLNSTILVVRLNGEEPNDSRMKKRLSECNDEFLKVLFFKMNRGRVLPFFFFLIKNFFSVRGWGAIYIGDYRSKWMHLVAKTQRNTVVNYLDDGASTIGFYKRLKGGDIVFPWAVHLITEMNLSATPEVNVTSIKKNKTKNKVTDKETVLFIGMGLVEGGYMRVDDYLYFLDKVFMKFSWCNVVYIPHRIEKIEKIESICNQKGVVVKQIDQPIEEYVNSLDVVPFNIVSFYSSALIGLSSMISGPKYYSYKIDIDMLDPTIKDNVFGVYEYLSHLDNVEIISD